MSDQSGADGPSLGFAAGDPLGRPLRTDRRSPVSGLLLTSAVGAATYLAWGLATWMPASRLRWTALTDVIAASLLFLIPLAVGGLFRGLSRWSLPAEVGLRYLIGNLVLLAAAGTLELFGRFSVATLAVLALVMAGLGPILATAFLVRSGWKPVAFPAMATLLWAVAAAAVSLGAVAFWRTLSPPPYQPVWDGLLHATVANSLGEGSFSLLLSDYTDAFNFNAYLPGHHLRLALASSLTGVDVLHLQWGAPFVYSSVMALGIYALVDRSSSDSIAFFAASLAPFVQYLTKSPAVVASFLPASEAVALTPFVLAPLLPGRERRTWAGAALLIALMVPIHAIHAGLLLLTLAGAALIQLAIARWNAVRLAALVGIVAAAAFVFAGDLAALLPDGLLFDPTGSYADITPTADLGSRFRLMGRFLPEVLAGAAVLGATIWLSTKAASRSRLAAVVLAAAVLYVVPVPGLERLHGVLMVAIPVGVGYLLMLTAPLFGRVAVRSRTAGRALSVATPVIVLLLLLPILGRPLSAFRDRQLDATDLTGIASSFADYELETLTELRGTLEGGRLALSDPITQSMLEAFSGVDTPGGPYHPEATRDALRQALTRSAAGAAVALRDLEQLNGSPFYLVISGRTLWWANQRGSAARAVFRPRHLSLLPEGRVADDKFAVLRRLENTGCVEAVDDRDELVILTVSCT